MKFDPNFILKGLNGEELTGEIDNIHAGKVLAQALFYSTDKDRLKFHDWALKLYKQEPLELDESDRKKLMHFIEESKFPGITYAPLIKLLDGNNV